MLFYLHNYASDGRPGRKVNENYGREILELHSLGIVDGQQAYTEGDVKAVSRVLSGRTLELDSRDETWHSYRFRPDLHSGEAVTVLGGQWSRPERPTLADRQIHGERDGDRLVEFLARHPSTARHISWKLAQRFVSDLPPMSLVERVAQVYLENDTEIRPTLRALLTSPEFAASVGHKSKRPHDWLVSTLRSTRARIPGEIRVDLQNAPFQLAEVSGRIGQRFFDCATPDGYPEFAAAWNSSNSVLGRWNQGALIARNLLTRPDSSSRVDVPVRELAPTAEVADVGGVVSWVASVHFHFHPSPSEVSAICAGLGIAPTASVPTLIANELLFRECVAYLIAHPAFQRR